MLNLFTRIKPISENPGAWGFWNLYCGMEPDVNVVPITAVHEGKAPWNFAEVRVI